MPQTGLSAESMNEATRRNQIDYCKRLRCTRSSKAGIVMRVLFRRDFASCRERVVRRPLTEGSPAEPLNSQSFAIVCSGWQELAAVRNKREARIGDAPG